jgi:hypothetical protein
MSASSDGSAKVEEVWREVAGQKAQLLDCCSQVKKDLTNVEQELWNCLISLIAVAVVWPNLITAQIPG